LSTRYVKRTTITDIKTFLKRKIKGEAIAYWDHDKISGTSLTIPFNCPAYQKGYLTREARENLDLNCTEFDYYEGIHLSFGLDESTFNKNKFKVPPDADKQEKAEFKKKVNVFRTQQKKCEEECPIIKKLREIDKIAVEGFEKVLIVDSGIPVDMLEGGVYELSKELKDGAATIHFFDTREQGVKFKLKDTYTSENLKIDKINGLISYRIVDPAKLIKNVPRWARTSFRRLNQWIGGTRSKPIPGVCPKCGHKNRPGGNFCVSCRTPLQYDKDVVDIESGTIKRAVSNLSAEEIIRGGAHIDETLKTGLDAEMLRWGLELISITLSNIDGGEDLNLYGEAIKAQQKTKLTQMKQEYEVQKIQSDAEKARLRELEKAKLQADIDRIKLETKKEETELEMIKKKQLLDHELLMKKTDAKIEKSKAKILASDKAMYQAKELMAATKQPLGYQKTSSATESVSSLAPDDPKNIQIKELNEKIKAMDEALHSGTIQQDKYEAVVNRLKTKLNRLIDSL